MQDLLLLRFDFGHAHRAFRFEVFAQHFARRAGDMFLKIFSRSSCEEPLSAMISDLGLHFAQQQLDAAVVDVEQVLEHEHLVEDLLREVAS